MALADRSIGLQARLQQRLERVGARERLDAELFRVAADLLGRYQDELPAGEREWLELAVARASGVAIEPALAVFLEQLTRSLTAAPEELIEHVTRAQQRAELGGD